MTGGPWRLLVLDRDPQDPKWIIATVAIPGEVRPAVLEAEGRYDVWAASAAWVAAQMTGQPSLTPVHDPLAWQVDEK
jgi:hypothetical protein